MTDTQLVEVRGAVKHFQVRGSRGGRADVVHAVDGVDLTVARGETLGVVGETGCGKSTLARCIAGLIPLSGGRVMYAGKDVAGLSGTQRRDFARHVQMVFQDPYASLNPRRRVAAIIGDPLVVHHKMRGEARRERVAELMQLVGLNPDHADRFPAEFSGGQRQRIGIARALALTPELLVCDEPVSALDVSIQAQIINLLGDLQSELSLTYVFISHDLAVVEHVSDRVAVMYLGKVVELAPASQLFAAPQHPYTVALLSASMVPDPDATTRRGTVALSGDVPSPINPPPGCRFHTRCPRAQAICAQQEPQLKAAGTGDAGLVACHFPVRPGESLAGPESGGEVATS